MVPIISFKETTGHGQVGFSMGGHSLVAGKSIVKQKILPGPGLEVHSDMPATSGEKELVGNVAKALTHEYLEEVEALRNVFELSARWQHSNPKNQPCSSFGGRAMKFSGPKNVLFVNLRVPSHGPHGIL